MIIDKNGNRIYRNINDIYLQLQNEAFSRKLGEINIADKTLIVFRNYDNHLFRKSNSFGFNLFLLEHASSFKAIVLKTDKEEIFHIPLEYILNNGEFLCFQKQGFEKQIFLNLDLIKKLPSNKIYDNNIHT